MFGIFRLVNKLLLISCIILLTSCQQILESRVKNNGSPVPRNFREKIIFDYYSALRNKRYKKAYQLRAWHLSPITVTFEYFVKIHNENHQSLPTIISIGEERKNRSNNEACGYNYTVYAAYPEDSVLVSGEVTMHSKLDAPGTCLIGYNSAFGSVP